MKTHASLSLKAVAVLFALTGVSPAEPTVLWSIGTRDNSGKELGLERDLHRFAKEVPADLVFRAGQDPATKWPYIHAGPIDKWGGETSHPLTVKFDLPTVPTGQCALVVNTLGTYAHLRENLQVSINGNTTVEPLPQGPGDIVLRDETKAKPSSTRFEFFPELLTTGTNTISLTIIDGAWALYDNVQLEVDEAKKPVLLSQPHVEQSLLLTTSTVSKGELNHVLRGSIRNAGPPVWLNITAQTGYKHKKANGQVEVLNGSQDGPAVQLRFGNNSFEVLVPTTEEQNTATIHLSAGTDQFHIEVPVAPVKPWKIYLQPSIHTDIGYTDRQIDVFHRHNANLDKVLEMCATNPLFKWSIEVAWEVENYFADRPADKQQELISLVKQNRLGLNGGYLNLLTSLMSDEAMNHYAYYAASLKRKYGAPFSASLMTDIPSATRALASAMAASGIRYFSEGCNEDRGPTITNSGIHAPFYWEGPGGEKVLTWLSQGYAQSSWFAQSRDVNQLYDNVEGIIRNREKYADQYPYDAAYVYGAFLDNGEIDTRYGALLKEWNARYAYPQIFITRGPEFFEYLEKNFADKIPVRKTDFGAFWEDGAGSTQQETNLHLANEHRITMAEKLWSLAKLGGAKEAYPLERFQKSWEDILFYIEHTWGAAQSISSPDDPMTIDQWKVKAEYAHRPEAETRALLQEGLQAYVKTVPAKKGELVVINPSSWPRSGPVELEDAVSRSEENPNIQPDAARIAKESKPRDFVWVDNVPALASKVVKADFSTAGKPVSTESQPGVLENAHYKVRLSKEHGIESIVDKDTGAELVDANQPYGFAQFVYASGGEGTRMIHPDQGPFATFELNTSAGAALNPPRHTVYVTPAQVTDIQMEPGVGPIWSEIKILSSAPSMPQVATYVRLYNKEKRIRFDIETALPKEEIRKKEAVYVAFPFRGGTPKFRLGMTNAVQRPDKDFAHGACHEWHCITDFVTCADEKSGNEIVWTSPDAPLVCLGDINRGRWISDPKLTTPTVFSYTMNNYWHTNYKAGQGGHFHFRYDVTSGKAGFTNEQCIRFARETAQPLLASVSSGVEAGQQTPGIAVHGKGVILGTVKAAEDGNGTVVRLRNVEEAATTAELNVTGGSVKQAELLNLVEESTSTPLRFEKGKISLPMQGQQVATVRLY
jgi:hypothetical protein